MLYKKILKKINRLSEKMQNMSDEELRKYTNVFRKKIKQEKSITKIPVEILVEAFAVVREADKRILGLYPTDEQVLGALVLYDGNVAEMKTGEGKSLVATLPLYVKALYRSPVFLITTNDYLAKRDCQRIGEVYRWLGLKVVEGVNDSEEEFDVENKKKIYSGDIIYTSSSTLGFDFLLDGLSEGKSEKFMPPLRFAILDEVDEILLDAAQMPLIISGAPKVQSNYFRVSKDFVEILKEDKDFSFDETQENVWLTEKGITKAKKYFSIQNLLDKKYFSLYQHLILALKAKCIFKKGRDYLVEDGKIKLLDKKDGRILDGTNLQSGLHQAIESKEGVEITPETQVISSITYQNLFRKFQQLSGMSGTVKIVENELLDTYNLSVKKIKNHKKNIRVDHKAIKYSTFEAKVEAAIEKIKELHSKGRPILIITGSLEASNLFSMRLLELGIVHNLLNAKSSVKEAQIIKEAGDVGSVTVSTTMSGRGTDIKITKAAVDKGGLAVILTERMENQRIEMQARGRAGRQGEPGDTYAFESLEDDVVRFHVQENVQRYYDKNKLSTKKIKSWKIHRAFIQAQQISEEKAQRERINSLQFDEISRLQKKKIDESRNIIMKLSSIPEALKLIKAIFFEGLEQNPELTNNIPRFILDYIDYNFKIELDRKEFENFEEKTNFLWGVFKENFEKKRKQLNDDFAFIKYLQIVILKAIDTSWSKQVSFLNQLRFVVYRRTTAQKKPFLEYDQEAQRSYEQNSKELTMLILKNISLSLLEVKKGELIVTFP